MEIFSKYLESAKLYKTANYFFVVLGFMLAGGALNQENIYKLLLLYFIFAILIYGALYTNNYLVDKPNTVNPQEKEKILNIATVSILIGFFLVYKFFPSLVSYVLLIIVINLLYVAILKRLSITLAVLIISFTGPLKVLMGITLAGASAFGFLYFFMSHYLALVALHALRNYNKDRISKRTLLNIAYFSFSLLIVITLFNRILNLYVPVFFLAFTAIVYFLYFQNLKFVKKYLV